MSDEVRKHLYDILEAIENVDIHLNRQRNFNSYMGSLTIRRAIERELEIIGEATNRILKEAPEIQISHGRQIVDLRNRVIHAYDAVDELIIWKVINRDLPVLNDEIRKLLDS
jgi:uncharacterized protein with HEPN domain